MEKLWIFAATVFIFVFLSTSFVSLAATEYPDCISCTKNNHNWVIWATWPWPSGYCTDGCWVGGWKVGECPCGIVCGVAKNPSECPGYCNYPKDCGSGKTCIKNVCKVCGEVLIESDCAGDCCWIPPAEGYPNGKCVAKSYGCENKWVCGNEYCKVNEKCCNFIIEEGASFAECYDPNKQDCFTNGVCTRGKPTITADPTGFKETDLQKVPSLNYHTIKIKNTDVPSNICPLSAFSVKVEKCPYGWTCKFLKGEFDIAPGGEVVVSLSIRPQENLIAGTYTITVNATNKRTNEKGSTDIKYEVGITTTTTSTSTTTTTTSTTSTTSTTTTLPKGKHKLSLKGGYNLVGTNARTVLSDFSKCKLNFITVEGKGSADTPFEGWAQGSKDKSGLYLTNRMEPYLGYLVYVNEDCEVTPSGEVQEIAHLTIKEGYNLIASPAKLTVKDFADAGCELNYITIEGKGSPDTPFETWAQGSKRKDLRLVSEMEPYVGYLLYASKGCSIEVKGKLGL